MFLWNVFSQTITVGLKPVALPELVPVTHTVTSVWLLLALFQVARRGWRPFFGSAIS